MKNHFKSMASGLLFIALITSFSCAQESPFTSTENTIDGVKIKIYDPEKTIADTFKFRSKIGVDIALEALKDYLKKPNLNISLLMEYARTNRVKNIMRPYLEALV